MTPDMPPAAVTGLGLRLKLLHVANACATKIPLPGPPGRG